MSTLSYTFDWQRDEHAKVVGILVRELFSTGFRRVLKWLVAAILVVEGIYVVVMVALGELQHVLVLIGLLAVVIPLAIMFYRITGQVRAWQLGRADPNVKHPIKHTLDEAGYHIVTHTATIDLKWDGLHKVRETPDFFLVHYSRHYAYYLPKRVLGSEDVDAVRSLIRERLPESVTYETD